MMIETCPSETVAASAERIWTLLTRPQDLARWSGSKVVDGPQADTLAVGDRLVLAPGFGLRATLEVRALDPGRELTVDVSLPLGVLNHETVRITPLVGGRCQVSFG